MTDVARDRLEHWKSKLIDLSLRNKLINYRPSRASSVPIVDEVPRVVAERLLAEERSFKFLAKPEEGEAPKGGDEFRRLEDEDLTPLHQDLMLQTTVTQKDLDKTLYNLYLKSRTSFQEQGTVTLFLAIGMLRWFETPTSEEPRLAPILLVPAALSRKGVGRPFELRAVSEDPEVNPSLLRKLLVDFGVRPDLPESHGDLDPDTVLEAFRTALPDPRWAVLTDMHLSLFSFSKYLMYRDLEDQAEALVGHRIVGRLAGVATEGGVEGDLPDPTKLDGLRPPEAVHQILDADSSQQTAIEAVRRGHDLVLQGPPGTGKSQTIANLVAEGLADGKTVLFVSEKMAALEVVKKRLDKAGLGDYVLELHSRHAVKREVVQELRRCLERDRAGSPPGAEELARLEESKKTLDGYVASLHLPFGEGGLTPFDALASLATLEDSPYLVCPLDRPEDLGSDERRRLESLVADVARTKGGVSPTDKHPWRFSRLTSVPRVVQIEIEKALPPLGDATTELARVLEARSEELALSPPEDLDGADNFLELLSHLSRSPGPEPAWVADRGWAGAGPEGGSLAKKLGRYSAGRKELARHYTGALFELALDDLAARRRQHGTGFFRLFRPSWWADRKLIKSVLRPGASRPNEDQIADLSRAVEIRDVGAEIDEADRRGGEIFGKFWRGRETDAEELDALAKWMRRLKELLGDREVPGTLAEAAVEARRHDAGRDEVRKALAKVRDELKRLGDLTKASAHPVKIDELALWPGEAADGIEQIHEWASYRLARDEADAAGLTPFLTGAAEAGTPSEGLPAAWEKAFFVLFLDRARAKRTPIDRFHRKTHEETIERFRELDKRQMELASSRIRSILDADLPSARSFSPESDVGLLLREASKKRRHLPIRKLLDRAGAAVRRLKPCFMMSPLSVAQYLPVGSEPFDIVVFDEASQICPEDAIGAVARGAQIVVVGDSKQLPPTSFFSYDPDLAMDEEEEAPPDLESILDLCSTSGLPSLRLRWHYRSRDESLIAFSNHHFYDGALFTFPNPGDRPGLGVELIHVEDGIYDRGGTRTNRVEAQAVARGIADQIMADPTLSIGAVTFSEAQQRAVLEELDALLAADRELERRFTAYEDEPPFVKNLENVQGDERDIMFFSVGYGRDEDGKLTMNFGPLNGEGGHRRLNVAVTRAKRAVRVFSSILPDDIDPERTRSRGALLLRDYLDYARRGVEAVVGQEEKAPAGKFEGAVAAALEDEGYLVSHRIGASSFRLDLAVAKPDDPDRIVLGIECDGQAYRHAATTRDRDRTRPLVLARLGWRLAKAWSPDWVRSPKSERERLKELVESAPPPDEPPPPPPPPAPPPEVEPENAEQAEENSAPAEEDLPEAPPYRPTPKSRRRPRRPLAEDSSELPKLVTAIVLEEGPIHEDELARRIADSYETRTTKKVRNATAFGVRESEAEGKILRRGEFLWPPGKEDCSLRGPEKDGTTRPIEWVPPEEIRDGIRTVLSVDLRLPREPLKKEVARLLGHKRPSDSTLGRVEDVLADFIADGQATEDGDYVAVVE